MNVHTVDIAGFTSHAVTTVQLPERGVVVVTGPNGAGKSSLLEAVSVALWGRTLRGTSPWKEGVPGHAAVTTDLVAMAKRSRTKSGRTSLAWHLPGQGVTTYETTTKAQTALEAVVGPWDVWRRACVFSSADAAHFTLATDKERKLLLEELLGLGRFDVAHAAALADLRASEGKHQHALRQAELLAERVRSARTLLEQTAVHKQDADADAAQLQQLLATQTEAHANLRDAKRAYREADEALTATGDRMRATKHAHQAAVEHQQALVTGKPCPTCKRPQLEPCTPAENDTATQQVADTLAAREAAEQVFREARDRHVHADDLLHRAREAAAKVDHAVDSHHLGEARRQRAIDNHRKAKAALVDAEDAADTAQADLLTAAVDLALAQAEVKVLGTRGVRAHVLGQALGGLQALANAWLARLAGPGLHLVLEAPPETDAGAPSDRLTLDVQGAGGGHGYRAASAGERRRIDVALLLALGDLAAAAHGQQPGTMWMDEVLDGLDDAGRERAVALLPDLAADRCVVVITHNADLVQALPAAHRLRVVDGQVQHV